MTPETIALVRGVLPEHEPFHYYPDRESAWLLAQLMPEAASVRDLRVAPFAKLLDRPSIKPLVAQSGGVLQRSDVLALARCDWSKPAVAEVAYGPAARTFERSLTDWGTDVDDYGWGQISRPGGNLVVQVNFPAEHQALFYQHMPHDRRKDLEMPMHPIRENRTPTMAWVRVDLCLETGVALVEEVQSDWFRELSWLIGQAERNKARSRDLRNYQAYQKAVLARFGKDWAKATLLAALVLLREELGLREVYMHQAWSGPKLKRIAGTAPPKSLYTALPSWFCFEPTQEAPAFLHQPASKILRRMRSDKRAPFWRLRFN